MAPNHNHCSISEIFFVVHQSPRCQKEASRWIKIMVNSSSSCKPQLKSTSNRWNPTIKTLMIKWWSSQNNSKQCLHHPSHQSRIRLTVLKPLKPRSIHQSLRDIPLWSRLTGVIYYWTVDSIQKLVACGLWNMRSDHQDSVSSSSRQNSKKTLFWTPRISTTTSKCVLIHWLDSEKTFFLVTSPSKGTLILNNTSSYIVITLHILGMFIYKLPLGTHC